MRCDLSAILVTWGLRDYGLDPVIWSDGSVSSYGLEKTPEEYIEHTVQIFREVRRVMRHDAVLFLNLGDSYNGSGGAGGDYNSGGLKDGQPKYGPKKCSNLKPKDLCGIPWRVALALQNDGWWLRSAMPWVKRSAMPESVTDRPASALEYVFLLSKSQKYFFDMDAVRVAHKDESIERYKHNFSREKIDGTGYVMADNYKTVHGNPAGRNFRNTDLFFESLEPPFGAIFADDELVGLDINPEAMKEAHFATFPRRLPEVAILAGASEKGCCVECGSPWERVVEKELKNVNRKDGGIIQPAPYDKRPFSSGRAGDSNSKTIGWQRTCKCDTPGTHDEDCAGRGGHYCTVLDPFGGSGTTSIVAHRYGRKSIIIELSETYINEIAIPRIKKATAQRGLF